MYHGRWPSHKAKAKAYSLVATFGSVGMPNLSLLQPLKTQGDDKICAPPPKLASACDLSRYRLLSLKHAKLFTALNNALLSQRSLTNWLKKTSQ